MNNSIKNQTYPKISQHISIDWLYDTIVSMSPKPMLLPSHAMRNKQIRMKIHIIGDLNFESELEWCVQSVKLNSLEIKSRNLDWPIFKLKLWKKHLKLQTFQQLCSMKSAHLDKGGVHFLMLLSYLKIPIIKKKVRFCLKLIFFVMFSGCLYVLNKALDKVYSKQLRSYEPVNWRK